MTLARSPHGVRRERPVDVGSANIRRGGSPLPAGAAEETRLAPLRPHGMQQNAHDGIPRRVLRAKFPVQGRDAYLHGDTGGEGRRRPGVPLGMRVQPKGI